MDDNVNISCVSTLNPYHNYSDSLLSFSIKPLLFLAQMFDAAKSNRVSVNHLITFSDSMQSNSSKRYFPVVSILTIFGQRCSLFGC